MSDGQVGRVLYREILRWARKADGVPLRVRSEDVRLLLPKAQTASDTVAELQLLQQQQQAASPRFISYEIRRLTRVGFKSGSLWESDQAEEGLDRGFEALRTLNSAYARRLEELQHQRATHTAREEILCSIGQVFRHRKYGYKGVVCGWDRICARDLHWAKNLGLRHDQPFYEVLPDEDESSRLFGSTRISKYVAQENVEIATGTRVLHRALNNYFRGFSPSLGRYIPGDSLQYTYPDLYEALDIEPIGDDSNLLSRADTYSGTHTPVRRKQILVDVG